VIEFKPRDLIPENYMEVLHQVRGLGDVEFWTIGDIAVALEDEAEGNLPKVRAVRQAIADVGGIMPETVRRYKSCAVFFPPEVREEYTQLTRYHFRAAKVAGDLDGAKEWLTKAVVSADNYGGAPMPVRTLLALIRDKKRALDEEQANQRDLNSALRRAETALDRAIGFAVNNSKECREGLFVALAAVQDVRESCGK